MKCKIVNFKTHGDERGNLIAIEQNNEIPFEIKRIYYIFDTIDGVRRGYHAHKELQQMLICIHGSCKILLDDGDEKKIVELDDPSKGLYLNDVLWREMYDFSADAVLLVIVSDYYSEDDYIRDYTDFLRFKKKISCEKSTIN